MYVKILTTTSLAISLAFAAAVPAHADDEDGSWFSRLFGGGEQKQERDQRRRELSESERDLIRGYYREHGDAPKKQRQLPPGLQKKVQRGGSLPPGWQKKLQRGEVLPEDVYAHRQPLPPRLVEQLPPQPDGTRLYRIDNEVVRVVTATRVLADVFGLD